LSDPLSGTCPCGWGLWEEGYAPNRQRHAAWHLDWATGVRVPDRVILSPPTGRPWGDVRAIRGDDRGQANRRLAYRMARLFQREGGYDFPAVSDARVADRPQTVYVRETGERLIAAAFVFAAERWSLWSGGDDYGHPEPGNAPEIGAIWVAFHYRRQGVASDLVREVAAAEGVAVADLCWFGPLTDEGKALAFSLSGGQPVRVS
jgi:GNAT superfamily N-acetyltransferase